jgi:type I restriction enzyme S subunit
MNWVEITVGEYCPFIYGKGLPKAKRKFGSVPVYGSNGVVDYHEVGCVKKHGVIIGRKGTCGAVHLSQSDFWPIDTAFFTTKDTIEETRFVYYLLSTLGMEKMNSDSAVPGLNRENAHGIKIKIPEQLSDRQKLGQYLALFDKKIQNNTQMNQTLEKIAQRIFKSWFIDFDPVKANAEGIPFAGLSPDIQSLFPKEFVESKMGLIPKGWEVKSLGDFCTKVSAGGTPKRSEKSYWDGDISWLSSGEVRKRITISSEQSITELGLKNSSAKVFPDATTVIAMYGATAGEVTLLAEPIATNQACCGLIPKKHYREFLFLAASVEKERLASKSSGAAQQNLNKGIIESHDFISPSLEIVTKFQSVVGPMFEKWISNERQNSNLKKVRDRLLPKLLSGSIEIKQELEKLDEAS